MGGSVDSMEGGALCGTGVESFICSGGFGTLDCSFVSVVGCGGWV